LFKEVLSRNRGLSNNKLLKEELFEEISKSSPKIARTLSLGGQEKIKSFRISGECIEWDNY